MANNRRKRHLGEALITGLRLEPDLARDLLVYAESQATAHGVAVNVAAAARDLLRRGLAATRGQHATCCDREGYFAGLAEARRKIAEAIR